MQRCTGVPPVPNRVLLRASSFSSSSLVARADGCADSAAGSGDALSGRARAAGERRAGAMRDARCARFGARFGGVR
eukprot:6180501-Pleurochrysis_carterae.AAC.2